MSVLSGNLLESRAERGFSFQSALLAESFNTNFLDGTDVAGVPQVQQVLDDKQGLAA